MTDDMTTAPYQQFHPQPCANCGHREFHGVIAGCVTRDQSGAWCPCRQYKAPRDRATDAAEGQRLAQEGMAAAETGHDMTVNPDGPRWRAKAEEALDDLIRSGVAFTAENLTDRVGVAPSPSAIGALFRARRNDMAQVGWANSTRRAAHGRPLRIWKGIQA